MRLFLSTVFSIVMYVISFAQVPLSQIEGRLDVHLPYDTTSAHIGFHAGEEQDANDILYNTFIGSYTGQHNTSGGYNSFIGSNAGWGNQTGESNTFVGFASGAHLVEGNQNSYFGAFSGYGAFTETNEGDYNSYFGFGAGAATETGSFNSFFGRKAGTMLKDGNSNVGVGAHSLHMIRDRNYNVAVGDSAMYHVGNNFEGFDGSQWLSLTSKNANSTEKNIIAPLDFQIITNGRPSEVNRVELVAMAFLPNWAGPEVAAAPIHLPQNAVLTSFTVKYWDNSNDQMQVFLVRSEIGNPKSDESIKELKSFGQSSSMRSKSAVLPDDGMIIDNENFLYYIAARNISPDVFLGLSIYLYSVELNYKI